MPIIDLSFRFGASFPRLSITIRRVFSSLRVPPTGIITLALLGLLAAPAMAQRSTPLKLLQPAGAIGDRFGAAVAIDGDTMIVGASNHGVGTNFAQGSAYVYRWTGSAWTPEATLTAADGAANDLFGTSVAISGDTAIVGAYLGDVGANVNQGAAYVFTRSGTTWTQQAKLTAADGAASDTFGRSVALSGNTALVGAPLDDIGAISNQGSAYVFTRSGTSWTQQAKLIAADGASNDDFGISVAISGETALVGAYLDDVGANLNQGSAYVFTRSGAAWTLQAHITANDGAAADTFGAAVAISGDTALVGAFSDSVGANIDQGSAYVFTRSGGVWTQQAQLTAADGAANDQLGFSVALSGNTAILGANLDDVGTIGDQGSAYVFTRSGSTWTQQAKLTAPDGMLEDNFGNAVGISGDIAVVGAYLDDAGTDTDQGSAWVFSRVGSKWIGPDLTIRAADGAAVDRFGVSVAISGDTAVVGASLDDVGLNANQGSAYVFTRSGNDWTQQAKLTASDGGLEDRFGISVAIFADTIIVGAASDDVGANTDQGSAYVFTRSGTAWSQQAKLTATEGAQGDSFGASVAISGDTAIIGASFDMVGSNAFQGSAYAFSRTGTTWTQQAKLIAADGLGGDLFGSSVAVSGDTALVGAFQHDVGANTNQGAAYVFARIGVIWTQQAQLTALDGAANDSFGVSVAMSGNSAIVGATLDDVGTNINQGSAYVFTRAGTAWSQEARLNAADGAASDNFGSAVAISGNTALVGAYLDDVGPINNQGSAYVFSRSGTTWTQQAQLAAGGGAANDSFGDTLALSGDTAIVGVQLEDFISNTDQGSARTFDVAADDLSLAHNDVTDASYPSLAAALLPATSGQQITATEAAWRGIGSVNTLGRSLALLSSGDLRTPSTSTLELGGSSVLDASAGNVELNGQFRVSPNAGADVYTALFTLGSRGIMTARTNSSLSINAPVANLQGQTRLEQGSSLTFAGSATAIGPTTCNLNSSLTSGGLFTNIDTFTIATGTIAAPLFFSRDVFDVFGTSAIFGSFTNDFGALATIRSGSLFVFGSLTNNGTIVGTLCSSCRGGSPNLDVGGDLALGPAASLSMPFADSLVHLGGSFDCAINSNTRFDLSLATLQLEGTTSGVLEQTLELMSTDLGPTPAGLDRTQPGNYPIGTLHIGPALSTVRLVDAHDNDNLGQAACEALYVNHLQIDAGSHLINPTCRIYYNTATIQGTVDVPANLIRIASGPACDPDTNQDGVADQGDVDYLINVIAGGPNPTNIDPDFNQDGVADQGDIDGIINVIAGGPCP